MTGGRQAASGPAGAGHPPRLAAADGGRPSRTAAADSGAERTGAAPARRTARQMYVRFALQRVPAPCGLRRAWGRRGRPRRVGRGERVTGEEGAATPSWPGGGLECLVVAPTQPECPGRGPLQAWATLELGKRKARGGLTTGALCQLGTQLRRTQGLSCLPPRQAYWGGRGVDDARGRSQEPDSRDRISPGHH